MSVIHYGDLVVYNRCAIRRGAISSCIDVNAGEIIVLLPSKDKTVKHKMYMKVFRNDQDHHAHIYSDAGYTKMHGFIRLRKCVITVDERSNTISISGDKFKDSMSASNNSFMFEVKNLRDTLNWKNSLMPYAE